MNESKSHIDIGIYMGKLLNVKEIILTATNFYSKYFFQPSTQLAALWKSDIKFR